ncbi:MAG: hypothetical protein QM278_06890 [Pseudomonadota bacterium]|nr:hypothetical protein [Pseudomonadota bacterium]
MRARSFPLPSPGKGSILLGLIIAMTAIAIVGAGMVALYSSSTLTQTAHAGGQRAYFLAESGFRYAACRYLNESTDANRLAVLSALDDKVFNLADNDGSFKLKVYPYWFTATSVSGKNLTVKVHGQLESSLALSSGNLWINNVRYPYTGVSGATSGAKSFTFVAATDWPAIASGTVVYSAALPSAAQTVTKGGNLTLSGTGTGAFPLINGNFRIDTNPTVYTYQKRNGNTLQGVDLVDSSRTWTNLAVGASATVVLDKYLRLDSTGSFGTYNRQVIYNIPIGWMSGDAEMRKVQHHDTFDTMSNWQAPTGGGGGTHGIQAVDGGNALKVNSATSGTNLGNLALSFFNYGGTEANLAQSWMDAQGFLTYDLQVKARNDQPNFMAGMGFRSRNNADGTDFYTYGVSFLKPRQIKSCILWICSDWGAPNDLPSDLIPGYASDAAAGPLFSNPGLFRNLEEATSLGFLGTGTQNRYGLPAIVLWQRTATGNKWLAYRTLTTADGIVTYTSSSKAWRLVNWSTLMVRVAEGCTLAFTGGGGLTGVGVPIKSGDTITNSDGTKSARVIMTPILTGGTWATRTAQGTFVLSSIKGNAFVAGEGLFVGGAQRATAAGPLNATKRNFIRVYYTRPTTQGTANAIETDNNRLANPRGSFNWPPDDLTDLAAANDFVTLVQWTDYNTGVSAVTSTSQPEAIIETGDLVTGTWDDTSTPANFSGDSISLMTMSDKATNTYYDDFGIQLFIKSSSGFLPPIQQ